MTEKALCRDDILKADDLPRKSVPVPEWKGKVYVRTLTSAERDEFEQMFVDMSTGERRTKIDNMRARLVVLATVDERGKRLFSNSDLVKLGDKNAAAVSRIFDAASSLNGLQQEDIEGLAKN